MPPKGGRKKGAASDGSATPHLPTLAEQLSYMHLPRPFKNPHYNKNANRRAKNLKAVLSQERERERAERERRRLLKQGEIEMELDPTGASEDRAPDETTMDVDPDTSQAVKQDLEATEVSKPAGAVEEEVPAYTSIEAPPSVWPPRHYCDITGLEAPYTDPATGLRFHDTSVYQLIKGLSTSTAKEYLAARGVSTVVK
ncbi:hypothetical protein JOM56_007779 [Amanita muscaria]